MAMHTCNPNIQDDRDRRIPTSSRTDRTTSPCLFLSASPKGCRGDSRKVFATKSGNLSSIPKTHTEERSEDEISTSCPLNSSCVLWHMHTPTQEINVKKKDIDTAFLKGKNSY